MTTRRATFHKATAVRWVSVDERVESGAPAPKSELDPLFTLVAGEGDGFLLGLAAGDAAGGAWELGYSAVTEQATVIAYELIQHRRIDDHRLREALIELDGSNDEEPVDRSETADFRSWLTGARSGSPVLSSRPSLDGVARAPVVGVAFRKEPDVLVSETIALGRMFDRDASSLVANLIASTATAASCFAQSGRDLIAGVAEAVLPVIGHLGAQVTGGERLGGLSQQFDEILRNVGVTSGAEALDLVGGNSSDPIQAVQAALLLSAPANERFHGAVEQSARIGGSALGAFAGAVIGSRIGIKGWPWAFANDTWFAEIGRRLVRGPNQIEDLPIPYAVEHHLMYGPRPGFS